MLSPHCKITYVSKQPLIHVTKISCYYILNYKKNCLIILAKFLKKILKLLISQQRSSSEQFCNYGKMKMSEIIIFIKKNVLDWQLTVNQKSWYIWNISFLKHLLLELMTKGTLRIQLAHLTDNVSCSNMATTWTNFNNKHLYNSN